MKKCSICGYVNNNSSKFCVECGTPLHMKISSQINNSKSKKEILIEILNEYRYSINKTKYGNFVSVEEMGERKQNLLKFDAGLELDSVIGLFDTSVSLSFKDIWKGSTETPCKEGLLFALSGFYDHTGPHSGSHYIRYTDIRSMEVEEKKDGNLIINGSFTILGAFYWTESLKEMLGKICAVNNQNKSYTEVIQSGKKSGVISSRMRQYGYERELIAYQRCSREYELKLQRQADLFLSQTNAWKTKRDEYEALLDEYEATIKELEEIISQNNSSEYKQRLKNISKYQKQLEALKY